MLWLLRQWLSFLMLQSDLLQPCLHCMLRLQSDDSSMVYLLSLRKLHEGEHCKLCLQNLKHSLSYIITRNLLEPEMVLEKRLETPQCTLPWRLKA